ncbi:MAG: M16 family metallopeptidase [Flavisolibacter sp.]
MKRTALLLWLLSISVAGAWAQTRLVEKVTKNGDELVIPYEKYILPNGLTLIVHEDHSDPVARVDVTYHVGSAREEIGKSGFAHFFEHMMFQGSDNVADEQHFKIVTEAGGTLNGSTNRDRTNYYETVPVNQLEKALWLEADRMGFLLDAVTQPKFEVQRATVKNERGQNYDNRPYGLQSEYIARALYPYGHPYSWLTIGYLEDLNRSDVNDLKNFFLRWYGPNNATLTVGGDVKPAEVVKLVEKYFGSIPRGPEVKAQDKTPVTLDKTRYVSYVDNYARASQLRMVYPTVPEYHQDGPALACLAQVFGGGGGGGRGRGGGGNRNSVFYQVMIKPQKALAASAFNQTSELAGEFSISVTPYPDNSLAEMEKLVDEAFEEFENRGVTDDDVEKFKAAFESRTINGLQSVAGKVSTLAAFETFAGNPNMIKTLLDMYGKLTKEDVMRVYNKYIKNKNHVVLSTLAKGQQDLIAAADNYTVDTTKYVKPDYGYAGLKYVKAKDNFDRSKIPAGGENPVVTVPAFWRKDLPGGIKVIGAENTELPVVTISISIPGGHLLQAGDISKAGLASFFARMMNEDTKNYSAEEFSLELEKLGSSISVGSSTDAIIFSVQTLKKNLDKTLQLLEERMFRPKFSEEAFDRIKAQALQAVKQSKSQPAAVASAVFAKLNYGPDHILALPEDGTEKTIPNIQFSDVENYYKNYMTSMDTKVVVVGDVSEKEILPKLAFLNKLPRKKITLPKIDPTPVVDKTKVFMVDIPRAAQTEFRVGYATGLKYDATGDYYKASLMNFPLGGAFNSRINLNLREDKGWTYGARTTLSADEYSGDYFFSSGIKANATDSALVEVMNELTAYAKSGPSDEEVDFMKNAIGQRDALAYETGMQKAAFIGRILDYNLPANFVEQQNKILKSITKEQLHSMAGKYLRPEKMNILVVGDKQKIYDGVKKLGYDVVELDVDGNVVSKKAL